MQVDLVGQVALVAGGEGALGRAVIDRLATSGARVEQGVSPASVRQHAGRLDIVINLDPALITPQDGGGGEPAFDAVHAAMALCRQAAAVMSAGRVVNLGSIFGLVPSRTRSGLSGASAALFAQTRAAALELAPRGVLVNGVAALLESRPHTPLGRGARPEEVAQAVLFLLAAESSYVVGEIIRVDGGWSAGFARDF